MFDPSVRPIRFALVVSALSGVLLPLTGLLSPVGATQKGANKPAEKGAPKSKGPAAPPQTILDGTLEEAVVSGEQTLVGTVLPRRKVVVGSAVDGRVVEHLVEEGHWVTKGQPLAQLLTETVEIEIAGAKAELELRKEELRELENGSRSEEKVASEAQLESARALNQNAQAKLKRKKDLFQRGNVITQEDLDEAISVASAAQQAFVAAQATYEMVLKGPRDEKLAQARSKFAVQTEVVRQLEDRLKKYTIRSPFDGYVTQEFTEVGAWINKGDRVAEVVEVDPIEVQAAVPEVYVAELQEAIAAAEERNEPLKAGVRVDAISQREFEGVVERIVPSADTRTRTFPVKIRVDNPKQGSSHMIKPGMMCHVTVPVGRPQKAVLAPKDAIVLGGATPMIFRIDKTETGADTTENAFPVPVKLGINRGNQVQVIGDVSPGMKVVTRGNERLQPGQAVIHQSKTGDTGLSGTR